jgi:hypothetical protein
MLRRLRHPPLPQSAEDPGAEACGIAFVSAEYALEILDRLQLDVITSEVVA